MHRSATERDVHVSPGTFHATCARYLRKYASLVGLSNNFSICDADESKKAIKAILKDIEPTLKQHKLPAQLKPEVCMAEISRAKANGHDPDTFLRWLDDIDAGRQSTSSSARRAETTVVRRAVAKVYEKYTSRLRENNSVDFDDLLLFGAKLFLEHPRVTSTVQHV